MCSLTVDLCRKLDCIAEVTVVGGVEDIKHYLIRKEFIHGKLEKASTIEIDTPSPTHTARKRMRNSKEKVSGSKSARTKRRR